MVIDLGRIQYVHADREKPRYLSEADALWGDVDHAVHAFGLAVPVRASFRQRAVGGLTLGGGIGHLTRRFGLTIDSSGG